MRIAWCVLILLFQPGLVGPRGGLWTQDPPRAYKVISPATYEKVLDLVFQCDEANRGFDFVLRFEPSNAPESQIYIRQTVTKTKVLEYTSLSGNIYGKLDKILRYGVKEDAVEMAKQIQVKKRILDVPEAKLTNGGRGCRMRCLPRSSFWSNDVPKQSRALGRSPSMARTTVSPMT